MHTTKGAAASFLLCWSPSCREAVSTGLTRLEGHGKRGERGKRFALDAAHDGFCGEAAERRDGLDDGGHGLWPETCQIGAVVGDDGEVLGAAEAAVGGLAQRADGAEVCTRDGIDVRVALKDRVGGCGKVRRPQGIGGKNDTVESHTGLFDAASEDVLVLMRRCVRRRCTGDLDDVMRAAPQERPGGELAALTVVCADDGDVVSEVAVKGDDGQVNVLVAFDMQGVCTDDQAIHRVAAQHLEKGELSVLLLAGGTDHRLVSEIVKGDLDCVQQGGEKGMGDIGDDDADEIRAIEREVAPHVARYVLKLLDGGFDLCSRGVGDVSFVVDHERNGTGADAGEPSNIFDLCHGRNPFCYGRPGKSFCFPALCVIIVVSERDKLLWYD